MMDENGPHQEVVDSSRLLNATEGKEMPSGSMSTVILHLRKAMCRQGEAGLTDAQLLERFIEHRDEAAFAALVARPGSMVMGVCLRVVRNHQDAEDAFQATFLVLARKAASISSRELLANWLYGVAHNSALKARASSVKRHAKEKQVTKMPDPAMPGQERWNENLQALLDQELSRLPEKYRFPIILCDLGGKTRKEAALQLGCPEGSLSSRLSRARVMLAKRLARHGLTVSGGSLAALLSHQAASVGVPTSVAYVTDGGDHPKKYCRRVLRRKADPWRPGQTLAWQWGVDFRHACGYVHQLAEGLFSEGAQAEAWFRKWRRWLRDRRQGVAQVLRSAMWHYNNRKLAERLKRSGMTWSRAGGQVILDLRVLVLSRMWHPAHAAYLASRPQPSMVPAPSHDRAARKNLRIAA